MSDQNVVDFDPKSVAFYLRRKHPHKTAEHVAAAIDVPVETARQWLRGASTPNVVATLALVGAYGPELLAAALPSLPAWAARSLIAERRRVAMAELDRLNERLGELDHEVSLDGPEPSRLGRVVGGRVRDDLRPLRDRVADAAGG